MSDRSIFIDLSSPVRTGDLPGLARRFLVWWAGELSLLVPVSLRGLVPKGPERALLHVGEAHWRLEPVQPGASAVDIDSRQDDKAVGGQMARAAAMINLAQLVIVLPADVVLRRRIDLPMMPESQIASAVELQLDRLTPFTSENARMAVRVVARDPIEGRISVDVAVTPRAAVEALEQRLSRLGFKVAGVDFEDLNGRPAGFNLCPPKVVSSSRSLTMVRIGLAALVLLSWYFASAMWTAAREHEVESWQAHIAGLRPLAMRSGALRDKIDALTQPIAVAQAHRPLRVLLLLKELTTLLPDTARLTELNLNGDSVDISGLAADASSLITTLESSKLFKDARFKSPVMRNPDGNRDRFQISLTLEGAAKQ